MLEIFVGDVRFWRVGFLFLSLPRKVEDIFDKMYSVAKVFGSQLFSMSTFFFQGQLFFSKSTFFFKVNFFFRQLFVFPGQLFFKVNFFLKNFFFNFFAGVVRQLFSNFFSTPSQASFFLIRLSSHSVRSPSRYLAGRHSLPLVMR